MTRQWLSLPWKAAQKLEGLSVPGLTVLKTSRHRNKLKTGHLKGNRFSLRVRGVGDFGIAEAVVQQLQRLEVLRATR